MAHADKKTEWIPLMEYAVKSGLSLSTLRRYIKANKIEYKSENGKYWIMEGSHPKSGPEGSPNLEKRLIRLEQQLSKTQEELSELKMLIALYEDKLNQL